MFDINDVIVEIRGLQRSIIMLVLKCLAECTNNHVWGPLGPQDMTTCVTHVVVVVVVVGGDENAWGYDIRTKR